MQTGEEAARGRGVPRAGNRQLSGSPHDLRFPCAAPSSRPMPGATRPRATRACSRPRWNSSSKSMRSWPAPAWRSISARQTRNADARPTMTERHAGSLSLPQMAIRAAQRLDQECPRVPAIQHARPGQGKGRVEIRLCRAELAQNGELGCCLNDDVTGTSSCRFRPGLTISTFPRQRDRRTGSNALSIAN